MRTDLRSLFNRVDESNSLFVAFFEILCSPGRQEGILDMGSQLLSTVEIMSSICCCFCCTVCAMENLSVPVSDLTLR